MAILTQPCIFIGLLLTQICILFGGFYEPLATVGERNTLRRESEIKSDTKSNQKSIKIKVDSKSLDHVEKESWYTVFERQAIAPIYIGLNVELNGENRALNTPLGQVSDAQLVAQVSNRYKQFSDVRCATMLIEDQDLNVALGKASDCQLLVEVNTLSFLLKECLITYRYSCIEPNNNNIPFAPC